MGLTNDTLRDEVEPDRLMQDFYLSPAYDPKAARHADTVKAAIAFTLDAILPLFDREREAAFAALLSVAETTFEHFRATSAVSPFWNDDNRKTLNIVEELLMRSLRAAAIEARPVASTDGGERVS